MTPNNILNMVMLKNLDIIAITDHNSAKQLMIFKELSESYDFLIVPGIEVTVKEGFDVLCYFNTFEDALVLDEFLEQSLTDDWGNYTKENQVITDIYDLEQTTFNKSLQGTTLAYNELSVKVRELNGAIVLAHIDRKNQSALSNYNLDDIDFDAIEVQKYFKDSYIKDNPKLSKYITLYNSDSHSLLQISEQEEFIELENKTVPNLIKYLKGEKYE
jgi:PHP family Zn ribbon phosphoesterase